MADEADARLPPACVHGPLGDPKAAQLARIDPEGRSRPLSQATLRLLERLLEGEQAPGADGVVSGPGHDPDIPTGGQRRGKAPIGATCSVPKKFTPSADRPGPLGVLDCAAAMSSPTSSDDLFAEILDAPDRDGYPGAPRLVSYRNDDDPDYLSAIETRATRRAELWRRGIFHGNLAEVEPGAIGNGPPLSAIYAQRWHTARPIHLRAAFDPEEAREDLTRRARMHDELKEPGALRAFLRSEEEDLRPSFVVHPQHEKLPDPERDIEQVRLVWAQRPEDRNSPRIKDLWAKSAWLSNFEGEDSLRLRLSFGKNIIDDASRDLPRHRRVSELAEILLPESTLLHQSAPVTSLLEELAGGPVFFTQHIAYWNSPGGGALFHHDAFEEASLGGQRGVLFAQFTGRTAWLALSVEDLARRVIEFGEYLAEGELPWVRSQVFGRKSDFERFRKKCERFKALMRELAKPGCGFLGRLVNRGPEFTSFLADCGHAWFLEPGDALILPNHGLERTCAHSVFCASDSAGYGLSMAIRDVHPPSGPPTEPEPGEASAEPGGERREQGRARDSQGSRGPGGSKRPRRKGQRGKGSSSSRRSGSDNVRP